MQLETEGDLVCLDVRNGQVRWKRNFVEDFDGKFMAVWKFSESPLVDGDQPHLHSGRPPGHHGRLKQAQRRSDLEVRCP